MNQHGKCQTSSTRIKGVGTPPLLPTRTKYATRVTQLHVTIFMSKYGYLTHHHNSMYGEEWGGERKLHQTILFPFLLPLPFFTQLKCPRPGEKQERKLYGTQKIQKKKKILAFLVFHLFFFFSRSTFSPFFLFESFFILFSYVFPFPSSSYVFFFRSEALRSLLLSTERKQRDGEA